MTCLQLHCRFLLLLTVAQFGIVLCQEKCADGTFSLIKCETTGTCPADHICVNGHCCPNCRQKASLTNEIVKPVCDAHGNYASIQCNLEPGLCWCVTEDGKELPGTRVSERNRGSLNCDDERSKSSALTALDSWDRISQGMCPTPRTVGPCIDFCRSDLDCASNKKCCYNGCGRQCEEPVPIRGVRFGGSATTSKPGVCPVTSREPPRLLPRLSSECSADSSCPGIQKCCPSNAGNRCVTPDGHAETSRVFKPGSCPNLSSVSLQNARSLLTRPCQFDSDCPSEEKCCDTIYGKACSLPADRGGLLVTRRPGVCPIVRSLSDPRYRFGRSCQFDDECPETHKCCDTSFGRSCVFPDFQTGLSALPKAGRCPDVASGGGFGNKFFSFRERPCNGDAECPGAEKCCDTLSGRGCVLVDDYTEIETSTNRCPKENEEFSTCVAQCQVGCDTVQNPPYCPQVTCGSGCICKAGHVRLRSNDPFSRCVPIAECSSFRTSFNSYNQKATVSLVSSDRSIQGLLTLTDVNNQLQLTGSISGVQPGVYSFQVYEKGDISSPCNSVGLPLDFYPTKQKPISAASPSSSVSHFDSFRVESLGSTTINSNSVKVSLNGPNSIVGRALVLVRQELERLVGSYGTRVACGVIGIV